MRHSIIFKAVILLFFSQASLAQTQNQRLSEVEVFNRCYMKMSQSVVPRTASLGKTLVDRVMNKQMSGVDACVALIKQVRFLDNGTTLTQGDAGLPTISDKENEAIITNFHNFHNTWFTQRSLDYNSGDMSDGTLLIRDNDEPSLFITRALFNRNVQVSTIFTATSSLKSVRRIPGGNTSNYQSKTLEAPGEKSINNATSFVMAYGSSADGENTYRSMGMADNQLMTFGKLIGVENVQPLIVPRVDTSSTNNNRAGANDEFTAAIKSAATNINIKSHFGGGILGSQVFIMKNNNLILEAAGGTNNSSEGVIGRRMSRRIFEDLLCQQMPTLSADDVANDVMPNSSFGFRKSTSCMACHTSLDPMANTFRNLVGYKSADNNIYQGPVVGSPIYGVLSLPVSATSKVISLQPPTGALNYRDHTNVLIKKNVNSMVELGTELSRADDFYRCVAKRYYQFLTGYEVNLAPRNISVAQNTKQVQFHRAKVYELAQTLKQGQSISQLIQAILSSEAFVYRNYVAP